MDGFVVIRYDSERECSKLGQTHTKDEAKDIMFTDFKSKFEEKYGYEMTQRNIDFDEMLEEASGVNECELTDDTAYLNDLNHYDYDWVIIPVTL